MTLGAVSGWIATTVVTPEVVTLLNVTFDSWAGATATLSPARVLNSVEMARTTSPSTAPYSPVVLAENGQPKVGSCCARKKFAAAVIAALVPVPPTACRPMVTYAVTCESPPSHEPAGSCCASRKARYSLTCASKPGRSWMAQSNEPSPRIVYSNDCGLSAGPQPAGCRTGRTCAPDSCLSRLVRGRACERPRPAHSRARRRPWRP